MRGVKYYCLIISICLGCLSPYANSDGVPKCVIENYSVDDGLPHFDVTKIIEDSYGYIWLCTRNGLSRFDGYRFKNHFTSKESTVSHNRITDITEDRYRNLWIRTYDNKIYRFNRRLDSFEPLCQYSKQGDETIFAEMIQSTGGIVWLATISSQVIAASTDSVSNRLTCLNCDLSSKGTIRLLAEDNSGKGVWLASAQQIMHLTVNDQLSKWELKESFNLDSEMMVCATGDRQSVCFGSDKGSIIEYCYSDSSFNRYGLATKAPVNTLLSDPGGKTICAGSDNGFEIFDRTTKQSHRVMGITDRIVGLRSDNLGGIWIECDIRGAFRYNPANQTVRYFSQPVTLHESLLTQQNLDIQQVNGRMWVSLKGGGFGIYDPDKETLVPFHCDPRSEQDCLFSNAVLSFVVTDDDVIWLSTCDDHKGINRVTIVNEMIEPLHIRDTYTPQSTNSIKALYYDSKSNFWVGTRSEQLIRYAGRIDDNSPQQVITKWDGGEPLGFVYAITEDKEHNIWVGTRTNGIFRLTPNGKEYSIVNYRHATDNTHSLSENKVHSIVTDNAGRVWAATYGGGVNILQSVGDSLFLSPENGLNNYPKQRCQKVRALATDSKQRVWAGTTEGVLILTFDPVARDVETELHQFEAGDADCLASNDVVYVYCDRQGSMWVATYGGGLNKFMGYDKNHEPVYKWYKTSSDQKNNCILSIAEDADGNIWFATETNIGVVYKSNDCVTICGQKEGVDKSAVFAEGSVTVDSLGCIYFGSIQGVVYKVDPHQTTKERIGIKLEFTDLDINNHTIVPAANGELEQAVDIARRIRITDRKSTVAIGYAALNYGSQHKIHYHYKLEGYDREWVEGDESMQAVYSYLPYGKYTLHVKAFIPNDQDDATERSIEIVVVRPFYLGWAAISIYSLLLLLAVLGISKHFAAKKNIYQRDAENRRSVQIAPGLIAVNKKDDEVFIQNIMAFIEENYANQEMKIEDIANHTTQSRSAFYSRFKTLTGKSPIEFLIRFRLDKAKMYLKDTDYTIAEIAYRCGFSNPGYFTVSFKEAFNITPSEYRKSSGN